MGLCPYKNIRPALWRATERPRHRLLPWTLAQVSCTAERQGKAWQRLYTIEALPTELSHRARGGPCPM